MIMKLLKRSRRNKYYFRITFCSVLKCNTMLEDRNSCVYVCGARISNLSYLNMYQLAVPKVIGNN